MGTGHTLFVKEKNRGTNGSPGSPENSIIKGGDGLRRKSSEKSEKERRNSLEKELSEKIKSEEKILRENKILLPGIL